jgi:hypothetical protein
MMICPVCRQAAERVPDMRMLFAVRKAASGMIRFFGAGPLLIRPAVS